MKPDQVREWIGKYFLLVLSLAAGYIYIFAESPLLPISRSEAFAAGETIIPVFLGQLALIYRWYFSADAIDSANDVCVPPWLVKWPPLLAVLLIGMAVGSLVASNATGSRWAPDPETFRRVVVFSVSLLNVTTIIVITRYFGSREKLKADATAGAPH